MRKLWPAFQRLAGWQMVPAFDRLTMAPALGIHAQPVEGGIRSPPKEQQLVQSRPRSIARGL